MPDPGPPKGRTGAGAAWDTACRLPATTTDLDGQDTTYAYDLFCRRTYRAEPGGRSGRRSYASLGSVVDQRVRVETPASAGGAAATMKARTHIDGFGRV